MYDDGAIVNERRGSRIINDPSAVLVGYSTVCFGDTYVSRLLDELLIQLLFIRFVRSQNRPPIAW